MEEVKKTKNQFAEEAIDTYKKNPSQENLRSMINLLRPTTMMVPVNVNEQKKAEPMFLRNPEGMAYLAVFTGKDHVPEDLQKQTMMATPFPVCNGIVCNAPIEVSGMVINPYTNNILLDKQLIQRLFEADQKLAGKKRAEAAKHPYGMGNVLQFVHESFPQAIFSNAAECVEELCQRKEEKVHELLLEVVKKDSHSPSDYPVMAMNISDDLTVVRIDMPAPYVPQGAHRIYVTYQKSCEKANYFIIQQGDKKTEKRLIQIDENLEHQDVAEAPVEGVELQEIIELVSSEE